MADEEFEEDVEGDEEPIRVVIRVRPPAFGHDSQQVTVEPPDTLRVVRGGRQGEVRARFDSVLGKETSQPQVFRQVRPAVDAALSGLNSTIFAYGQTGSGKTFTLFGGLLPGEASGVSGMASELSEAADEGMAARALRQVFARVAESDAQGTRLAVSCSFLEVYNEHITDLLLPQGGKGAWGGAEGNAPPLHIRENAQREVHVHGLSEVPVHSVGHAFALVRRALRSRVVRSTNLNARSSRSHAVLQLVLEQAVAEPTGADDDGVTRGSALRARLNLVDLAGSERTGDAGSPILGNEHKREMAAINKSLSALANCISALSQEGRSHVPYRDSVLTRLLQDSLGGNSRTLLIATVSPSDRCVDESLSTLRFADRAKHVMLRAVPNPTDLGETLLQQRRRFEARIQRLQQEVGRLKEALKARHAGPQPLPPPPASELSSELQAQLAEMRADAVGDAQHKEALESIALKLADENESLRSHVAARDAELASERTEHQALLSALRAAGIDPVALKAGQVGVAQTAADASRAPPRASPAAAPQAAPAAGQGSSEDDVMIAEVMEELARQEKELSRIRAEERHIEALLRDRGAGGNAMRNGGSSLRPKPPSAAYVPKADPAQFGPPGGPPSARNWQPGGSLPPKRSGAQTSRSVGHALRSDPTSMHYDPRCDSNSRYYDPELDPNSRWFVGNKSHAATFGGGSSGGGGAPSWRASQPPGGSAWTGSAYGVPSGPPMGPGPRSAPPPPAPPLGSPGAKRGGRKGGNRGGNRGNQRGPKPPAGDMTAAGFGAATALAGNGAPVDIGSLYYVLGTQGSSSRVKQLQQMLQLRQGAAKASEEADRLVVAEGAGSP